ncbi:beta strand repeat-containing protein [Singulisphaera sp. GP187]|uniref:beta strand repeat-containing protein n=1 Tax=Singulisphaera sp. GP187 TaxID=1882752 RepID=UPI0020B135F5|nr:right-handed parallel beta-helix repeat-containing protein [Singulisphaera sp. GP187]
MSTFTVTNLNQAGAGSLRRAILESNGQPGSDSIDFQVSGTIRVGRISLPAITDTVTIDGSTAPSFAGTPVTTVDFQGSKGLRFERGADGSILRSLSLVKAGDAGVTLRASRVTVEGNYIGLLADGKTSAGNRGDGIRIDASSHDNLIGHRDPVTSVSYYNADAVGIQPVTGWQGIRPSNTSGQYLMVGTSSQNGLLYDGPISGVGGASYQVNYPGAMTTSVYGPDTVSGDTLRLVGSYKTGNDTVQGFLFEGTTADLGQSGNYRTIDYPGAKFTYVHSTMGDLAVGNADGPEGNLPIGTGHAFLYDVARNTLLPDIVYPGSTSTSAYGIWHNGLTSYTIVGGYSTLADSSGSLSNGYMVDYDSATGKFTQWTSFAYPNGPIGRDFITHFEGISSTESGVYTLNADSIQAGSTNPAQGSWVTVRRNPDRSFGAGVWVDLNYPGVDPRTSITSSNSVAGNQVVGLVIGASGTFSYQATVNTGFQLSNVISGNRGNGIGIYGSNDNQIAMNQIGTDASGTLQRGNAKNGILVTQGAARNLIGGQATGGNDPTASVFVRPPQGNLISGNNGNGVLINKGATRTLLSGNFVGTDGSGNSALGNRLDGVAIEHADGNQLIGCTFQQSPFVFYNVLSGNGGNGLRITNSNDTTVQANFMGVGANNATIVANGGNGLLVSGTSKNTQVGGVIPLGNVISGNNRNGIEVRDKASGFISFNTFAGIYAFGDAAPNRLNGILVTSSGGDNLIRTCIVSGNLGNGIELGGHATGVQVVDTAVGTNTSIQTPIPNQGSGIKISGHAHGNAIGGFQPSIEPQVTISSNRGYGIEIVGHANQNVVYHTYIGTNFNDTVALGNTLGGILLGTCKTSSNIIGGTATALQNKIVNNLGNGVSLRSSQRNAILGNEIADNLGYGLFATGLCTGTVVKANTITSNARGNVNLTKSQGIVFIP